MKVTALRERRAKLIADMRALIDASEAGGLTADDRAKFEAMRADADTLSQTIQLQTELEADERALVPESQRPAPQKATATPAEAHSGPTYTQALLSYLRRGMGELTPDERGVLQGGYSTFSAEERAQSTLSGAVGGFVVPPDTSFYGRIQEAQNFWGGMQRAGATVITTSTGAELPIPTTDDSANVGAIVAEEGSHASGTNVTLAQVVLRSYLYSTKIVKVSWQLLQDSAIDFEALLGRLFGTRLGRIQNTHFTVGTGGGQPMGVMTAATIGRTSATGFTVSVPADDLLRLFHSVDPAYRANARWMFSDTTALALRLLKDGDGQYLWRPGMTDDVPGTLFGKPIVINSDCVTMVANGRSIAFGDFSNYYIRRVRGIQVVRLNELYVENGQVGFVAFERADGALVDAGQHPVKVIVNSAS